jgi:hypothetical protein
VARCFRCVARSRLTGRRRWRLTRAIRQLAVRVFDLIDQRRHVRRSFGNGVAIFRQVASRSVDALRPPTHQYVPGAEHDAACLLNFVLYRDKAHGRSLCRLTDGLGVGHVVLLPIHEWFDIGRRDQPDHVAQLRELPPPVMRSATCFQCDHTPGWDEKNFISLVRTILLRNTTRPEALAP